MNPEQSTPSLELPPYLYGTPRYETASSNTASLFSPLGVILLYPVFVESFFRSASTSTFLSSSLATSSLILEAKRNSSSS